MGSIPTHFRISRQVVADLQTIRPDEDWEHYYLGNFLTDISQLRDPYACMHAKHSVVDDSSALWGWLRSIIALPWANDVLGEAKPESQRYGALCAYLRELAYVATHLVFSDSSPIHLAGASSNAVDQMFGGTPPSIQADELDRAFAAGMTQYYPHEHLDFPPYYDPGVEYTRNSGPLAAPRLIAYLDEYLDYLAGSLAALELDWLRARPRSRTDAARHDVVRRLGHALHAVEDFYFHSNFAECHQWLRLFTALGGGAADPAPHCLDGTVDDPSSVLLRRRMLRRLRYPAFARAPGGGTAPDRFWDDPSLSSSQDATALVYTGGFGTTDVYHSLKSGLGLLELVNLQAGLVTGLPPGSTPPAKEPIALWQLASDADTRRRAAQETDYKTLLVNRSNRQLFGTCQERITAARQAGLLSKEMADGLTRAVDIDFQIMIRNRRVGGVNRFLIEFLTTLQQALDENAAAVAEANARADSIQDTDTLTKASAETIGTHSLMAKDDDAEGPMRRVCIESAKHASRSIARLLVRRINRNTDPREGLDWPAILRHFVRYPNPSPASWESAIAAGVVRGSVPDSDRIADQPEARLLGPGNRPEELTRLRTGRRQADLEQRYHLMEEITDRR
jgi:hypothetical protein